MERLDVLLVRRQQFPSREKARRAIMAGQVEVEGKGGFNKDLAFRWFTKGKVIGPKEPFVSRAGRKLAHALDYFELDPQGFTCLDVGASTGGFTDCLMQRGASRVYAVDVGYGQLDYGLCNDPRVVVMERVNARHMPPDAIPESCNLITLDLSFISLVKVVPAILPFLAEDGWLLALIKPQFEVGREQVGKGGVVRDEGVRRRVVEQRTADLASSGLGVVGIVDSEVPGASGNRETFALFRQSK